MSYAAPSQPTSHDAREDERPLLEVVVDAGSEMLREPNVGRLAAIGAAIGFTVVAAVITVIGTVGGLGFGAALGLGVFIGLWSGVGAGFMLGATVPLSRYLEAAHRAEARHS
jgi:hypothetical protein